jgi:hypothetical protein
MMTYMVLIPLRLAHPSVWFVAIADDLFSFVKNENPPLN